MSAASASSASVYGLASMSSAAAEGNSFTASLSGLSVGTTYYYQAYVKVQGTGDKSSSVQTFTGDVNQFRTEAEEVGGLLELPARKSGFTYSDFGNGTSRNFNYCFDTGITPPSGWLIR